MAFMDMGGYGGELYPSPYPQKLSFFYPPKYDDVYITLDPKTYYQPSTVVESVFGRPEDTSPQQAYDRWQQVDTPTTVVTDTAQAFTDAASEAAKKLTAGISWIGAAVAAFVMLLILVLIKR